MAASSQSVRNYYKFLNLNDFESDRMLIKKRCNEKALAYQALNSEDATRKMKFLRIVYTTLKDEASRNSYNKLLKSYPELLQPCAPQIPLAGHFELCKTITIEGYFGLAAEVPISAEQHRDFKKFISSISQIFPNDVVWVDKAMRLYSAAWSFLDRIGYQNIFAITKIEDQQSARKELQDRLENTEKLLECLKKFREYKKLTEIRKERLIERIRSLISSKAGLEIKDEKGWNLLHFSAYYNLRDLASFILESASLEQQQLLMSAATNENKNTPLMMAERKENQAMIDLLKTKGLSCNLSFNYSHPSSSIIRQGRMMLFSQGKLVGVSGPEEDDKRFQFVKCLHRLKNNELTPACQAALIEAIQELIKSKSALSLSTTKSGWNVLHVAVTHNLKELVIWIRDNIPASEQQQLLAGITHRSGMTPLQMAQERRNKTLISILKGMQAGPAPLANPLTTGSASGSTLPEMTMSGPSAGMLTPNPRLANPTVVNPRGFYAPKDFPLNKSENSAPSVPRHGKS